jgi:hypothetical protein
MSATSARLLELSKLTEKAIDPAKFDFIKTFVPDQIRKRTQLGYGVPSENASNAKLEKLSPKYIIKRGNSDISENTSPARSNLTFTGDMLGSIMGTRNGLRFTFFFGTSAADKKAQWAREGGKGRPKRRFFDLSSSERNGLQRQISAIMRESLRALFK